MKSMFFRAAPLAAALTLALSACGAPLTPASPAAPEQGAAPTPVPVLTPDPSYTAAAAARDTRVLGTDRDRNGVRDDLDAYSAAQVEALRGPVLNYARATQALQAAPAGTQDQAASDLRLKAAAQLRALGGDALVTSLDAQLLNTSGRQTAFADREGKAAGAFVKLFAAPGARDGRLASGQLASAVVFQNGIFTTESSAAANLDALRTLLGDQPGVEYYLNYNPTDGLGDLMEVFAQKRSEGSFIEQLLGALRNISLDPGNLWDAVTSAVKILRSGIETVRTLHDGDAYMDGRVPALADRLETLLAGGRRVVLVPHSQGNLYANAVVDELRRRQVDLANLRIVGAAAPVDQLHLDGATYFNSRFDAVVGGLRVLFPVLESNDDSVPLVQGEDPVLQHSFVTIYTNPKFGIAGRLKEAVLQALQ